MIYIYRRVDSMSCSSSRSLIFLHDILHKCAHHHHHSYTFYRENERVRWIDWQRAGSSKRNELLACATTQSFSRFFRFFSYDMNPPYTQRYRTAKPADMIMMIYILCDITFLCFYFASHRQMQ